MLRIEHVALNVLEPAAMADWYVEHLGFTIALKVDKEPFARFLMDGAQASMLEIYRNPAAEVPDYRTRNPLELHIAFVADDVDAERQRLMDAGASPEGEVTTTPSGDRLAMLRDPWGVPIQLCQRAKPFAFGG